MSYGCTLAGTGDIEVSQNYSDYDHLIIDNTYWVVAFYVFGPKSVTNNFPNCFHTPN